MQHFLYAHGTPVTLIALLSLTGQIILLLQKMNIMQSMAPFVSGAGLGASRCCTGDHSNRVPGLAGWSRPAPSRHRPCAPVCPEACPAAGSHPGAAAGTWPAAGENPSLALQAMVLLLWGLYLEV